MAADVRHFPFHECHVAFWRMATLSSCDPQRRPLDATAITEKRLLILLLASVLAGQLPCPTLGQLHREKWGLRGCEPCPRCPPVYEREPGLRLLWDDSCCEYNHPCIENCRHQVCNSRWYGSIEAFKLFRDVSDDSPFASTGLTGPIVLSASGFDAKFESSAKIT